MQKKKLLLITVCALLLISVIGASVVVFAENNATHSWSGDAVSDSYDYGSVLKIPNRTVGGTDTAVSHILTFPDKTTSYADEVVLSQYGIYELVYSAKVAGKAYSEAHTFKVENPLYVTDKAESSVVYDYAPDLRPATNDITTGNPQKSLVVNLAKNDVLTFNQLISVADMGTTIPFVSGYLIPRSVGQSNFSEFYITLTDSENPDIYFTISVKERESDGQFGRSFVLAGGNGQGMVGVQAVKEGSSEATKNIYTNQYGVLAFIPFSGKSTIQHPVASYTYECYTDDYPFNFYFDPSSMELWHSTNYIHPTDKNGNGLADDYAMTPNRLETRIDNRNYRWFITDFDNTNYYTTLWSGFPSGYAKLSVHAGGYNGEFATFAISSVLGADISNAAFEITQKPVISLESEKLHDAGVGAWYLIPEASAADLYFGEIDCEVEVLYAYNSNNPISVNIVDGKFFAARPGYYAIKYTATNNVGLTTEKVVYVKASEDVKPVKVEFDADKQTSALALTFVPYSNVTLSGGSGRNGYKIYAKLGDHIIDTEDGFYPDMMGEWQVVCEAFDEIGQTTVESYTVTVTANDNYSILDNIPLPKVIISGGNYKMPEIYGKKLVNGEITSALCDVQIIASGKTTAVKAGESAYINVDNVGDTVTIKYLCNGQELFSETIPSVTLYQGGQMDYTQYFVGDHISAERSDDGCNIAIGSGETSFYYANPVAFEGIKIVLRCLAEKEYEEIVVTLRDSLDLDNAIEVKYVAVDGIVTMIVGENQYKTGYVFGDNNFDLLLDYTDGYVLWNETKFEVTENTNGKKFEGFKSDFVYVEVAVNTPEQSVICVDSIRDYAFNNQVSDRIEPYFYKPSTPKQADINTEFTIPGLVTGDMISPSITVAMQVKAPDGSIVKDINGVELSNCDPSLDYTIEINQVGTYRISYIIEEDNEFGVAAQFKRNYSYTLNVADTIAPKVTLTSDYTTEAKVGDVIIMPDFTVSDNHSEEDKITVYKYLITPTGQFVLVKGNSVKVSIAGNYTWKIFVYDEAGCLTVEKLSVVVE